MEHDHFNHPEKRNHIKNFFYRTASQGAITIVNYNDPVSYEEIMKIELATLRQRGESPYECLDNDETASAITSLVGAKILVIMTSTEGIYRDPKDSSSLVRDVIASTLEEVECKVHELQVSCVGASREGANGARAKLGFALKSVQGGATVIIGSARHRLSDLINGEVDCTRIGVV